MDAFSPSVVVDRLAANRGTFASLLRDAPAALRTWRPGRDHWCLLEIACHLHDEEREDFRARLAFVLEDPHRPMPPIDPPSWVEERRYMEQDYDAMLDRFLAEREASITWLRGLDDPAWDNVYDHPKAGPLSARMFLVNWLAHDLLHLRQVVRRHHQWLEAESGVRMDYAGEW